mmetsp:Transcript_15405/g.33301  ORF Transcript_15405/g.33301 Transcript_15405/m.33301 type:complete len:452 (+) Transcript_15405:1276-2631(+)
MGHEMVDAGRGLPVLDAERLLAPHVLDHGVAVLRQQLGDEVLDEQHHELQRHHHPEAGAVRAHHGGVPRERFPVVGEGVAEHEVDEARVEEDARGGQPLEQRQPHPQRRRLAAARVPRQRQHLEGVRAQLQEVVGEGVEGSERVHPPEQGDVPELEAEVQVVVEHPVHLGVVVDVEVVLLHHHGGQPRLAPRLGRRARAARRGEVPVVLGLLAGQVLVGLLHHQREDLQPQRRHLLEGHEFGHVGGEAVEVLQPEGVVAEGDVVLDEVHVEHAPHQVLLVLLLRLAVGEGAVPLQRAQRHKLAHRDEQRVHRQVGRHVAVHQRLTRPPAGAAVEVGAAQAEAPRGPHARGGVLQQEGDHHAHQHQRQQHRRHQRLVLVCLRQPPPVVQLGEATHHLELVGEEAPGGDQCVPLPLPQRQEENRPDGREAGEKRGAVPLDAPAAAPIQLQGSA